LKELRQHLKNKKISGIYLFTGVETYLQEVYLNRFIDLIFETGDKMMNLDIFDQDKGDIDKIEASLVTLPFLANKRVVIIRNMDLFNKKNKSKAERIVQSLNTLPDTTVCFIIESSVDKRSRLYKTVKEHGTVTEFEYLTEKELIQYIARELSKYQIKISSSDAKYFVETVGYDLQVVTKEVGKLIDYVGDEEIAKKEHIDNVCAKHLEAKIFDLVDAIGLKQRERSLRLFQDMVALKEPETRILFMISRQMMLIFQVKQFQQKRLSAYDIGKRLKVPDFVVRKLIDQSRQFSLEQMKTIIGELTELEYEFKSGKINLETGIELLIIKLSKKM